MSLKALHEGGGQVEVQADLSSDVSEVRPMGHGAPCVTSPSTRLGSESRKLKHPPVIHLLENFMIGTLLNQPDFITVDGLEGDETPPIP